MVNGNGKRIGNSTKEAGAGLVSHRVHTGDDGAVLCGDVGGN